LTLVLYSAILYSSNKKEEDIMHTNGGFLISKIKQIQGRVFEQLLQQHHIDQFNGAQGRILHVLWNEDNIPISELATKTGLAKTTLTSMLDRLEQAGYLTRIFDKGDRRKINIKLTEESKAMKDQYNLVSEHMSDIFYEGFTESEILEFEKYLDRILSNLSLKGEKNNE
jgi:DNA-binding MarR family transcriptional regulator